MLAGFFGLTNDEFIDMHILQRKEQQVWWVKCMDQEHDIIQVPMRSRRAFETMPVTTMKCLCPT